VNDAAIKKTFLERVASALRGLFKRKKADDISLAIYTKFREHLANSGISDEDPMFEQAYLAADFCEAALQTARQRLTLVERAQGLKVKIEELEAYLQLTDDDATKIKNLLNSFVALTKERNDLIYRLTNFDRSLPKLEHLLQDATNAIPEMQYGEKYHKALRQDIGFL